MVDWKNIDPSKIAEHCNKTYERYGVYPSLRDIFYRFVDELCLTPNLFTSISANGSEIID